MRERIEEIVSHVAGSRNWTAMEKLTGIKAKTWNTVVDGGQRPRSDMLEVIGDMWPQYAFGLLTGRTDEVSGHTSPILERIARDLRRVQKAG